jgi:EAL domain-containing protein (putative c-di-GMP-specific phosphodiesterase class I)
MRPRVELAIDDAGAGFASLRHILELHPAFVKVDRSIVAGVDTDLARQALMVGLRHFVGATHCRLIAEGIETDAELATLQSLDIGLGQGYLLGRPLPADGQLTASGP